MILKICLCIPTYNNPQTIGAVTLDALSKTEFPVLLVDDGSDPSVESALKTTAQLDPGAGLVFQAARDAGRLQILRFETNLGKGVALQKAIKFSVARGFTHLLALDGDGQHHVSEVHKVTRLALQYPWDLIIGNRKLQSASVPGISKFGRNFSNFWVRFQTGAEIADSQSGFRLYPLFFCQNMTFFTKRYDFEIEVLIRLMWKGVQVREVEIEVFYPEKNQRVSHFNKLWDNVRISCLNTVFVILSLLKTHRSPSEIAAATGAGVFIGCTPFFGLHTAIVALVSFVFRLNAGFLFLGSQVSIPPLAPFLILGSIGIGERVSSLWAPASLSAGNRATATSLFHLPSGQIPSSLHDWILFGSSHLSHWFIGSLVLGIILGSITGLVSYVFAKKIQRGGRSPLRASAEKKVTGAKNQPTWSGNTRGGKLGNGFLKLVLKYFDVRFGYFILLFIIPYFYLFAPKARRSSAEYWSILNPGLSPWRRQWYILRHLFCFGQVLMDRVAQSFSKTPYFRTNPVGMSNILAPLAEGRPVVLLGGHVGGWDLAASLLPKDGFSSELHIIEYHSELLSFHKVKSSRPVEHLKSVSSNLQEQPIFEIHQLLSEGKPIGLMGDRPLGERLELVLFMGRLAPFDVTPFRLAAASRAPLLFTFGFKAKKKVYDFYATPAKVYEYVKDEDRAIQCLKWTQTYATELELMVKKYPEQWFNFFNFWSAMPISPTAGAVARSPNYLAEELNKPHSREFAWESDSKANV